MHVEHAEAPLGAAVTGIDLSAGVDATTREAIQRLIDQRSVVVIRDQRLSPAQQVAFAAGFAPLDVHVLHQYLLPGHPELLVVSNVVEDGRAIGLADAGSAWHSDMSYMREPTWLSMLYAIEVPHDEAGEPMGDTLFVSTAWAWETLDPAMRARIAGLRGVHSHRARDAKRRAAGSTRIAMTDQQKARTPDVVHPIARTHPRTGRTCLYVNEAYSTTVEGWPEAEGRALIAELCAHCTRPESVHRHRWRAGDLLIWDNVATQHVASFDYGPDRRRLMHRTSSRGGVPF